MGPRPLRLPITAIQVGSVAMLMRSVALDRWITVVACLLLLAASAAVTRGRTWGVAVAFALGITFIGICALGIAPPMFAVLGVLAIRPFSRMLEHFVRFDRGAAILLASGAAALGTAGAFAWKAFAHDLFSAIPLLAPSDELHNGVLVAVIGAVASFAGLVWGQRSESDAARVRIAETSSETESLTEAAADAEAHADATDELDLGVEREHLTTARPG